MKIFAYCVTCVIALIALLGIYNHSNGIENHFLSMAGYAVAYFCVTLFIAKIYGLRKQAPIDIDDLDLDDSVINDLSKEQFVKPSSKVEENNDDDGFAIKQILTDKSTVIGRYYEEPIYDFVMVEFANGIQIKYIFSDTCEPYANGTNVDSTLFESGSLILPSGIVYTPEKVDIF